MKNHEKNKKHISLLEGSNWQWWGATGSDATFFVQLSQFSSQRCNAPTTSIASVAIYQKRPSYWQFLTSIKKSNHIYQNIYIKYIQISIYQTQVIHSLLFLFPFASSSLRDWRQCQSLRLPDRSPSDSSTGTCNRPWSNCPTDPTAKPPESNCAFKKGPLSFQ